MSRSHPLRALRFETVATLVALEARALARNRAACAVLVLAVVAAVSLRLGRDRLAELGRETCYIVYWERDDWVRRLEAAAERENPARLAIRVVHVGELVDDEGTIRYPPRAHSIQLRPAHRRNQAQNGPEPAWEVSLDEQPGRARVPGVSDALTSRRVERWTVWFWYSGSDPAALFPYSQWFWRVTSEHFGRPVEFEQQVSPLKPEASIGGRPLRLTTTALGGPELLEIGLVWMVVFFVACHLATHSLAEARSLRTLESLVVTPAGWHGAGTAKRLFHGGLALVLGAGVAAVLHPEALVRGGFWLALASAILVSLGVAFVAGSRCRSVAAAGAATVLYVMVAGALLAAAEQLSGGSGEPWTAAISFERSLLRVWQAAWGANATVSWPPIAGLIIWGFAWHMLGARSYRRLQIGP